jgi:hypothetical protein
MCRARPRFQSYGTVGSWRLGFCHDMSNTTVFLFRLSILLGLLTRSDPRHNKMSSCYHLRLIHSATIATIGYFVLAGYHHDVDVLCSTACPLGVLPLPDPTPISTPPPTPQFPYHAEIERRPVFQSCGISHMHCVGLASQISSTGMWGHDGGWVFTMIC